MEQIKDDLIGEIRYFFNKFEDNLDNEFGGCCLIDALEYAQKVLLDSNNEIEHRIAKNLISTYRGKTVERASALCASYMPDSRRLGSLMSHMQSFVNYGFNEDPIFCTIKSEIDSQYIKTIIFDCFGRSVHDLTTKDKASLKRIIEEIEMKRG